MLSVPDSDQKSSVSECDTHPSRKNSAASGSDVLQESDMTPLTEGSTSEDDAGWFGGIGADFRNIANSLKDAVPPTIGAIGDIANFVQRSALSVAAEIAQLERENEEGFETSLRLPWEITGDSSSEYPEYQENDELKTKILALSTDRSNFLEPYSVKGNSVEGEGKFVVLDDARIHLIRRLLEADENLAATHAQLSGRSDVKETIFWTNYFYNCEKTRREYLESVQSMSLIFSVSVPVEKNVSFDESASQTSQNSLVPADDSSGSQDGSTDNNGKSADDDSSYIQVNRNGIQSPPCSLKSVEDLVLVNKTISENKDDRSF